MTVQGVYAQDVESWKRELLAAGWKSIRATIWESPNRLLYRGPYLAWCVMKGLPCEPLTERETACGETENRK